LAKCLRNDAWLPVGENKLELLRRYSRLYLEYDLIFCGDDGQGDLLAGQKALFDGLAESGCESSGASDSEEGAELSCTGDPPGGRLLAVLIHEVSGGAPPLRFDPQEPHGEAWRAKWLARGLVCHRTYVGAAVALRDLGAGVSEADVEAVAMDAITDFVQTMQMNPGFDWEPARRDLEEDLRKAGFPSAIQQALERTSF